IDAPASTLVWIRQSYMRHAPLCDGEKFLHIRFYERKKDYEVVLRWKKLLGAKVKSLHQVLRNDWLRDCLEKLEPFRSLWMAFQLGCFPLILSWRCRQEIEYYLSQMYEIWYTITNGNAYLCDEYTIEKLGGLAPLWSSRDRSTIETMFATCQVFPRVHDSAIRAQILQRVLAIEGLILNFQTFFKHVKVLGPIMLPLRELFPASELFPPRDEFSLVSNHLPSVRDILFQRCYELHEENKQQCLVEYSALDARFMACSDPKKVAYWQLCLYLSRHTKSQWNSYKETKDQMGQSERPEWIIRLGSFAHKLGFASAEISSLCNQNPDLSQIRMHMLRERPNHIFSVPAEKFDAEAHSRQNGQTIFEPRPPAPTPLMTTDNTTTIRMPRSHPGLFLPTIWTALTQEPRYALTEYGILVLILMSFFERFESTSVSSTCEGFQRTEPAQPAWSPLRSSSVYSRPVNPDLASSHIDRFTFWRLPHSTDMRPEPIYECDSIQAEVMKVITDIRHQGTFAFFFLVDRSGQLKTCTPSQIGHRRKRSKRPNDIFYAYGRENSSMWVGRYLDSP
ncbi:hypothetical protein COCSADRAFT_86099, partial [Bipolaris sorokiniana ND90Pr]